jgi:hypothetical protein
MLNSVLLFAAVVAAASSSPSSSPPAAATPEADLRARVTDAHQRAQKFKGWDDYTAADKLYTEYEALPGDAREANRYRLRFFHAELLYDLGRWRDAAVAYADVVARDPHGEYARTCAYDRVLSIEHLVAKKPAAVNIDGKLGFRNDDDTPHNDVRRTMTWEPMPPPPPSPPELSDDERLLVEALHGYRALVDKSPDLDHDPRLREELAGVMFAEAYMFYKHAQPNALVLAREIITRFPEGAYASRGAEIVLSETRRTGDAAAVATELAHLRESPFAKNEDYPHVVREFAAPTPATPTPAR